MQMSKQGNGIILGWGRRVVWEDFSEKVTKRLWNKWQGTASCMQILGLVCRAEVMAKTGELKALGEASMAEMWWEKGKGEKNKVGGLWGSHDGESGFHSTCWAKPLRAPSKGVRWAHRLVEAHLAAAGEGWWKGPVGGRESWWLPSRTSLSREEAGTNTYNSGQVSYILNQSFTLKAETMASEKVIPAKDVEGLMDIWHSGSLDWVLSDYLMRKKENSILSKSLLEVG